MVIVAACLVALAAIGFLVYSYSANNNDSGNGEQTSVPMAADPWTPRSSEGFVGSQACRECHDEIADRYESTHPMWMALRDSDIAPEVENGEVGSFEVAPERRYVVVKKDGKPYHIEQGLDVDGNVIYEESHEVAFVLGSGTRGKSYVIERDGHLFASPISWYTSNDQWDLSPGYDENNSRFSRELTEGCLKCHSGSRVYDGAPMAADAKYKRPYFTEQGIGCERCHGPGKDHIAFQKNKSPGEDPIVNPINLTPARRDAVCNQCHLQGEVTFYRPGRTDSDFRPGDHFTDIWLVYLQVGASGSIAVQQPEQMYGSECYKKSGGQLSCVSCHDPHYRPNAEERDAHYNARCLQCHESPKQECSETAQRRNAAGDSCIKCHMPPRPASDVPHTSQTDHRVLRRPEDSPLVDPDESDASADLVLFQVQGEELSADVKERSEGLRLSNEAMSSPTEAKRLAQEAIDKLVRATKADPTDFEAWNQLAIAYMILNDGEGSRLAWERTMETSPRKVSGLFGQIAIARAEGRIGDTEELLKQLVAEEPWKAQWHADLALVIESLGGRTAEAAKAAERAVELDPTNPDTYPLAVSLLRRMGKFDKAKTLEDRVRRLQAARRPENRPLLDPNAPRITPPSESTEKPPP